MMDDEEKGLSDEDLEEVVGGSVDMKHVLHNWRTFLEAVQLDIGIGDILLGGKYKNKRVVVKEIGKDELGQPTINGKPLLNFRIEKHLPDSKKSKKTLDAEEEKK